MTHTVHKVIVTIGSVATGIGAFIIGAETVPFGLDAQDTGLTLIWIGTFANIISTVLRANWLPGVTTGVGSDG